MIGRDDQRRPNSASDAAACGSQSGMSIATNIRVAVRRCLRPDPERWREGTNGRSLGGYARAADASPARPRARSPPDNGARPCRRRGNHGPRRRRARAKPLRHPLAALDPWQGQGSLGRARCLLDLTSDEAGLAEQAEYGRLLHEEPFRLDFLRRRAHQGQALIDAPGQKVDTAQQPDGLGTQQGEVRLTGDIARPLEHRARGGEVAPDEGAVPPHAGRYQAVRPPSPSARSTARRPASTLSSNSRAPRDSARATQRDDWRTAHDADHCPTKRAGSPFRFGLRRTARRPAIPRMRAGNRRARGRRGQDSGRRRAGAGLLQLFAHGRALVSASVRASANRPVWRKYSAIWM